MIFVNFICASAVYALNCQEINLHGYDMNYDTVMHCIYQTGQRRAYQYDCMRLLQRDKLWALQSRMHLYKSRSCFFCYNQRKCENQKDLSVILCIYWYQWYIQVLWPTCYIYIAINKVSADRGINNLNSVNSLNLNGHTTQNIWIN